MDHVIGKILDALEEKGLRENTAIIITADNGTCCGRGKGQAKEIGCWEPLFVHWPGYVENQGVKSELIDFSDIFPTLADIAGAKIPEDYIHDGRSFLPLLMGEPYEEREFIFSFLDEKRLVRDRRWLLEGDGRFFDCGENRNPRGYKEYREVTGSDDPEVLKAKARFEKFLEDKPAPVDKVPN
jgi:arylsulfatase A-like enzyme